jgi:hypothetical protein
MASGFPPKVSANYPSNLGHPRLAVASKSQEVIHRVCPTFRRSNPEKNRTSDRYKESEPLTSSSGRMLERDEMRGHR